MRYMAKGKQIRALLSLGHQWPRETNKIPLAIAKERVPLATRNAQLVGENRPRMEKSNSKLHELVDCPLFTIAR